MNRLSIKILLKKYRHAVPLLIYAPIYLIWFSYLERTVTKSYHVIHMKIDDYIPFYEYFVIPYFLWFFYVAIVLMYLFFKDKTDYYKNCTFLFTGMTVFLMISALWPNGHHLRPYILPNENIFAQMVNQLYKVDTATNLWPSIHVYNSLAAHFAVIKCKNLRKYKWLCGSSLVLCISIILSTVLIKQHSIFDMITAFILAGVMYLVVYQAEFLWNGRLARKSSRGLRES